jgi:hypothetical protein
MTRAGIGLTLALFAVATAASGNDALAAAQPAPLQHGLLAAVPNQDGRPPPVPLTERWPWMVYVVLGTGSLVLLIILVLLAREAMARHDRQAGVLQPPTTPPSNVPENQ